MWISKTQNRIEVSRPVARHQGISHGAVVVFCVVLVVVTAAAIRLSTRCICAHRRRTPVWLHGEVMRQPPGAAGSISTFSLFQGMPSNLKAGERNVLAVADSDFTA